MRLPELQIWLHRNPHRERMAAKQHNAGILQHLLKQYTGSDSEFEITRNDKGKPFIVNGPHFSYSHSKQLCAFVVADQPVGIDVEFINPKRSWQAIAERHFHAKDLMHLNGKFPEHHFFRLWSQKEAWCKWAGGTLWDYLGLPVNSCPAPVLSTDLIKNFSCAVVTTQSFRTLRINTLS